MNDNDRKSKKYFHNFQITKQQREMIIQLKEKGFNINTLLKIHIEELYNEHC